MKLICWLLVAIIGIGAMAWAYFGYVRLDPGAPWASGLIYVNDGERSAVRGPIGFRHLRTTVCELPQTPMGGILLRVFGYQGEARRRSLATQLCEKLLLLDPKAAGIDEKALQSGRMPRPGRDEVLAGYQTAARERLAAAGHDFAVVGVLRRDVGLLVDCYLLPPHRSVAAVFDSRRAAAFPAVLVALTDAQLRDRKVCNGLEQLFPPLRFTTLAPLVRADRWPYYFYLTGEALVLLGGSLALMAIYGALARRVGWSVLRDALAELASRPKLLGGLHLVYFGLVIAVSVLVYDLPTLQKSLFVTVKQAITGMSVDVNQGFADPQNPLRVAGQAYGSQNILWAAAVTFFINFFIDSVAVITVPSLVVPGSGVLVALLRAALWGVVVAPVFVVLALPMLPHVATLLLEGEGYVLASFFGLLVAISLFRPDQGLGAWPRYVRSVTMNLKGMVLVAVVLAIAALYEAIEVILMNK